MSPKAVTSTADDTVMSDDDDAVEARLYECCVLYPANLAQKDEQSLLKEIDGIFADAGATIQEKDGWGQRGIAYPIKGQMEGKFVIYYVLMDPGKLREVDTALRIEKNLMRHMLIKPPKNYTIEKWGAKYEEWLKTRETVTQVRAREQEVKLQERIAAKAKRQADRKPERGVHTEKPVLEGEKLTQEIDKLISDDTFENL